MWMLELSAVHEKAGATTAALELVSPMGSLSLPSHGPRIRTLQASRSYVSSSWPICTSVVIFLGLGTLESNLGYPLVSQNTSRGRRTKSQDCMTQIYEPHPPPQENHKHGSFGENAPNPALLGWPYRCFGLSFMGGVGRGFLWRITEHRS